MNDIQLKLLTTVSEFGEMKEDWNKLIEQSTFANIFMSFEWMYAWWCTYHPDAQLRIVVIQDGQGKTIGIAPLMLTSFKRFGLEYKRLNMIGDGTHETNHVGFLLYNQKADEVIEKIFFAIHKKIEWDVINLNRLWKSNLIEKQIFAWAGKNLLFVKQKNTEYVFANLPDTFDEFLSNLQPRFRTKLRSTRKRLLEKFRVEFGVHTPDTLSEALQILFKNHSSRWHAVGEKGAFANFRRRAFYDVLTEKFCERGWLLFFYLKLDEKTIAQQYCFEYNNIVYQLQEGFDYKYAEYNVGNILRSYIIEYCIKNKKVAYDMLAYTSRNKLQWGNHVKRDLSIRILKRGLKNSVLLKSESLFEYAQRALEKHLSPNTYRALKTAFFGSNPIGRWIRTFRS